MTDDEKAVIRLLMECANYLRVAEQAGLLTVPDDLKRGRRVVPAVVRGSA